MFKFVCLEASKFVLFFGHNFFEHVDFHVCPYSIFFKLLQLSVLRLCDLLLRLGIQLFGSVPRNFDSHRILIAFALVLAMGRHQLTHSSALPFHESLVVFKCLLSKCLEYLFHRGLIYTVVFDVLSFFMTVT